MGLSTRLSPLVILHDRANGASNGAWMDITDAVSAAVEITGALAPLAVYFEVSIDNGESWFAAALIRCASPTQDRMISTSTGGMYFLEYARPLHALRARVGPPESGDLQEGLMAAITVRARAALA